MSTFGLRLHKGDFFSVTEAVKYIIIMVIVRASMESTGTADSRTK